MSVPSLCMYVGACNTIAIVTNIGIVLITATTFLTTAYYSSYSLLNVLTFSQHSAGSEASHTSTSAVGAKARRRLASLRVGAFVS